MRAIFFILICFSALNADFTKTEDIVKDNISKLKWQDDSIGNTMTWSAAIEYCEGLKLGKHSDWRLPNINEIESITDKSKAPTIVSAFEHTSSYFYWSSTTDDIVKFVALAVDFRDGNVYDNYKDGNYHVRCVRDGE